jgi:ketosteroid isomerase-like protein
MTLEPAERLRRAVEQEWNHGDVAGFTRCFAEDAELQPDATYPDGGTTITGRGEITRFFRSIHRPVELGPLSTVGDQVMCRFRWADSSPEVAFDWAFLYRFEGEHVVRARYYRDADHASLAAHAEAI